MAQDRWLADRVNLELGTARSSVLWIEGHAPDAASPSLRTGLAASIVAPAPLSALTPENLPRPPSRFDMIAVAGMLAGARSLADVIERAASLLVGDGVLLVEELCWERLDPETARWFFGFQDAVARERRFRVSKRKFADRLDDWQAEHAGLRTGDEIVQALGESFELVSVEHGAHLGRMLDWDGATTYEQMAIDAGVIRPMGLRVTGALPGG